MKMTRLLRHDLPPEIIQLWTQAESPALLPLQEQAIRQHGLFDGGNLLIQAPTSSGKTFIGEMAAIQTALRRKKVVYLVPLKALAEEKFRDFSAKYAPYGIRVIVSSRDRREFDRDLESGDFSIAVVVYEKFAQALVRRPERLAEIDLVVADELELLSDPERGAMAELLLTRVLRAQCRVIGLSAVIGHAERLAEWMGAGLVYSERRPVELRYGVLHEGTFHYRTHNEQGEGEEALCDGGNAWETLALNVCALAGRGESCLVFVKAKHESRRDAERLAESAELPAAESVIAALEDLEPTRSRAGLLRTLPSGVAFHNADLSPEERAAVEQGFRDGSVRILVSTSTLAIGLNLPAANVFIAPEKWRFDLRLGIPWKTPLQRNEYENMAGRAGRLGAGRGFGRALLLAATPFDRETLWRRYVEGDREGIAPRLAEMSLEDPVLQLIAARTCRNRAELGAFLDATLTGRWIWRERLTLDAVEAKVHAAALRCIDLGLVTDDAAGLLEPTPFGAAAAAKGVTIATAQALAAWIAVSETRHWDPIELIHAALDTADARLLQVGLTTREYEEGIHADRMRARCAGMPERAETPLGRFLLNPRPPRFEQVRALKTALLLDDWRQGAALHGLEEAYDTMAGQVLAAADLAGWLLDAAAAIAAALGCGAAFVRRIERTAAAVQTGLPENLLPVAQAMGQPADRRAALALATSGLDAPEAIAAADGALLEQLLGPKPAKRLRAWAVNAAKAARGRDAKSDAAPPAARLILDERRPGEAVLDGQRIRLQEKQYRLLGLLAERPGECVPYDDIYARLWPDVVVEPNQMHFQKRRLVQALAGAAPGGQGLVTTVPKRGFRLNLPAAAVRMLASRSRAA